MMPHHRRSDSAAAAVVAAQNAAQPPIEPPEYVDVPEAAKPFWRALMRNRPRDRWNAADLANAAVLARAQADVERLAAEIAAEGDIIDGKLNPKHPLMETTIKRVAAVSRLIHVHAVATEGRAHDAGNALRNEREAEAQHDDLIPVRRVA